jgi:hypothetical protein
MSFSSQLGTIQLGAWQLGAIGSSPNLTGSFTASAGPSVAVSGIGGIQRPFTSVLGTIVLGLWQLGQVPAGSVTSAETFGKGSFQGSAFPSCVAHTPAPTGSFSGSAYPTCVVRGNKGPLLIAFTAFPSCAAADIAYYADGSFTCSPDPQVIVQGTQTGALIFTAFPDVVLSPLIGQQVDCLVGPNPPDAIVSNYVY